jgi:hypothetical protein
MWIMLVPVILYTNTSRNRYFLSLPGIFKAVVVPEDGLFRIRGWIFFIPFKFNPFEQRRKKGRKKKEKTRTRKKKKRPWRLSNLRTMRGALRSFRIKRLEADIDTDDFTLNAWLVPVFSAVNGENVHLQVNFEGHQSLLMDLRVTLGSILWNIIRAKYRIFKPY